MNKIEEAAKKYGFTYYGKFVPELNRYEFLQLNELNDEVIIGDSFYITVDIIRTTTTETLGKWWEEREAEDIKTFQQRLTMG